jgi:hypothetical protein
MSNVEGDYSPWQGSMNANKEQGTSNVEQEFCTLLVFFTNNVSTIKEQPDSKLDPKLLKTVN